MKRNLMFTVAIIFICGSAYSQKNMLTGKITDEKSGAPLMGASIYIPDLKVGVRANEDGTYSTSSLPAGKYLVEISFIGFETIFETIDITGTVENNF